jgi:hypothetical protein
VSILEDTGPLGVSGAVLLRTYAASQGDTDALRLARLGGRDLGRGRHDLFASDGDDERIAPAGLKLAQHNGAI